MYRCADKKSKHYNLTVNLKEVNNKIGKALSFLKVWEKEVKTYIDFTKTKLKEIELDTKDKTGSITLQIWRLKSKKRKYIENNMSIKKDDEEQKIYENKKKTYEKEIKFLRKQIEKEDDNERNDILELEMFIYMLNHTADYYKKANYVQKGKIAQLLFLNIKIDPQKRLLIQPKAGLETLFTLNWWR